MKKIPLYVIGAHIVLLLGLAVFRIAQPKEVPHRSVKVNHVAVVPPKKPTPKPCPKPEPCPKPVPCPTPKKLTPKPCPGKTPPPQSSQESSCKKPPQTARRDKLRAAMQKQLASLDTKQSVGPIKTEALVFENSYRDTLVSYLENALTLPEQGNVKIALTVNRSGVVKSVLVKEAPSKANETFVEKMVPMLLFPPFEGNFKGESSHTFAITLTSH